MFFVVVYWKSFCFAGLYRLFGFWVRFGFFRFSYRCGGFYFRRFFFLVIDIWELLLFWLFVFGTGGGDFFFILCLVLRGRGLVVGLG